MKSFSFCILLLISVLSCQDQFAEKNKLSGPISFSTDSQSYMKSDTINLTLQNDSNDYITIGLRCGRYLEMSYQKKENSRWSDKLSFEYMSLRCPTMLDTVQEKGAFTELLPASRFDSEGTFRLMVKIYKPPADSSETLISNPFRIE